MGRYFHPPKRSDVRGWLKTELLYSFGERFWECRGPRLRQRDLGTVVDNLVSAGHAAADVRGRLHAIRRRGRRQA